MSVGFMDVRSRSCRRPIGDWSQGRPDWHTAELQPGRNYHPCRRLIQAFADEIFGRHMDKWSAEVLLVYLTRC